MPGLTQVPMPPGAAARLRGHSKPAESSPSQRSDRPHASLPGGPPPPPPPPAAFQYPAGRRPCASDLLRSDPLSAPGEAPLIPTVRDDTRSQASDNSVVPVATPRKVSPRRGPSVQQLQLSLAAANAERRRLGAEMVEVHNVTSATAVRAERDAARSQSLAGEVSELRSRALSAERAAQDARSRCESLEALVSELRAAQAGAAGERDAAFARAAEGSRAYAELQRSESAQRARAADLEEVVSKQGRVVAQLQTEQARADVLQRDTIRQRAEVESRESGQTAAADAQRRLSLELEAANCAVREANERATRWDEENGELRAEMTRSKEECIAALERLATAEAKCTALSAQVQELELSKSHAVGLEARYEALKARDCNRADEIDDQQVVIAGLRTRLAERDADAVEVARLSQQLESLRAELEKERECRDAAEHEAAKSGAALADARQKVLSLTEKGAASAPQEQPKAEQPQQGTTAAAPPAAVHAELVGRITGLEGVLEKRQRDLDRCVETNDALREKVRRLDREAADRRTEEDQRSVLQLQLALKTELINKLEGQLEKKNDVERELRAECEAHQAASEKLEAELEQAVLVRKEVEARLVDLEREASVRVSEAEAACELSREKAARGQGEREDLERAFSESRALNRRISEERVALAEELSVLREVHSTLQKEALCRDVELQELTRVADRERRAHETSEQQLLECRDRLLVSEKQRRECELAAATMEQRLASESQVSQQRLSHAGALVDELRRSLADRGNEVDEKQKALVVERERSASTERRVREAEDEIRDLRCGISQLESDLSLSRAQLREARVDRDEAAAEAAKHEAATASAKAAAETAERLLRQESEAAAHLRRDLSAAREEAQQCRRLDAFRDDPRTSSTGRGDSGGSELRALSAELARCKEELRQRRRGDGDRELEWQRRVANLEQKAASTADSGSRCAEMESRVRELKAENDRLHKDLSAVRNEASRAKERVLQLQDQCGRRL
eukprot:TRINITY_DN18198_c0_g1_i1.p1 TRINITY_DN18198_c0_g1~~TRINITY_DN18198_c0_g1_i1.p1  ORF type:complete len:1008 (+),score=204.31 TRINITY_DN18198_c0_g1_i1:69-3026(+)